MTLAPRVSRSFWLIGGLALLLGPLHFWSRENWRDLTVPPTSVERLELGYSDQLKLLAHARELIPEGQTYTTAADDLDAEMSLFMFSLSELMGRLPMPTTYFSEPVPGGGRNARYVVAHQCQTDEAGLKLLGRFEEGCVYERIGADG